MTPRLQDLDNCETFYAQICPLCASTGDGKLASQTCAKIEAIRQKLGRPFADISLAIVNMDIKLI